MSIETCYDVLTIGSLAVLVLLALVCLVRCILGPRISDRVMAVNMIGTLTIIMVVMGVHIAFLTPAASASASLLHGNEWSNAKAIWRTVPIVILATWATISAIVVALGVALF